MAVIHSYITGLFWKAPELLRESGRHGSQKGDVYAFSIILYEIVGRRCPFGFLPFEPKTVIEFIKEPPESATEPFRPELESIIDMGNIPEYIIDCIKECWDEQPEKRPDFPLIR